MPKPVTAAELETIVRLVTRLTHDDMLTVFATLVQEKPEDFIATALSYMEQVERYAETKNDKQNKV